MTKHLLSALGIGFFTLLAPNTQAQQVVLDFEDLSGFAPLPAGYGGVADWGSWAASDLPDANYGVNGLVRAFSVGLQLPIQFGQEVIFEGANVVTGNPFSFELYHLGSLVHTSAIVSPNIGGPPVWLDSGYAGLVDELRYVSLVNIFGVDEFTYTIPLNVTSYCDGNAATCPCGNVGAAGEGCFNSTNSGGVLAASGTALISNDDLIISASGLVPNRPGLLFSGTESVNTGNGFVFGDGLRCAGGAVQRISVVTADAGGNSSWGPGLAGSLGWSGGDQRFLQLWYRDPGGPCSSGFNLTQALEIQFLP